LKSKLFFALGVLTPILLTMFIYPVYSMDYLEFYEKYVIRTDPVEPHDVINTQIYGSGSGIYFISHSIISCNYKIYYEDTGEYWGCNAGFSPSGILYHVDDTPLIFMKFQVLHEELKKYNDAYDIEAGYAVLSLTHVHDAENMLVMFVQINPEADNSGNGSVNEYMYIWWGIVKYDLENGDIEYEPINGSVTTIILDPSTMYSNPVEVTIIPAVYTDYGPNNTMRAIFGFYNIYKVGGQKYANFSIAWKTLYFDEKNRTKFIIFLDSFRDWWVWIGQGYFAKTDGFDIKYGQPIFNLDPNSESYCDIRYMDVFVYNAVLDKNKYFEDWILGKLPEYNYTSVIDLTSKAVDNTALYSNAVVYVATFAAFAVFVRRLRIPYIGIIAAVVTAGILSFMNNDASYLIVSFIASLPIIGSVIGGEGET